MRFKKIWLFIYSASY